MITITLNCSLNNEFGHKLETLSVQRLGNTASWGGGDIFMAGGNLCSKGTLHGMHGMG